MKSSIATTSFKGGLSVAFKPSAVFPLVILTRLTTAESNTTPRNENVSFPSRNGTANEPSEAFSVSKYSMLLPATSTSVKIAPKADVTPGVFVPGKKKLTSVMMLSSAVNSRCGLNAAKSQG